MLSKINLDATDLVALSGGHTIGLGHCASFESRLFPRQDPTLNATFAGHLRRTCPAKGTDRRTPLDVRTPDARTARRRRPGNGITVFVDT